VVEHREGVAVLENVGAVFLADRGGEDRIPPEQNDYFEGRIRPLLKRAGRAVGPRS
jgi:hypothetical protein